MTGATAGNLPVFADSTGQVIQDSGTSLASILATPYAVPVGLDPTGTTDCTAAINAAINSLTHSGTVLLPPGLFLAKGITLNTGIRLVGAGPYATILYSGGADATIVTFPASTARAALVNMSLFGGGFGKVIGGFAFFGGAIPTVNPVVLINANGDNHIIENCLIEGGYNTVEVFSQDTYILDSQIAYGFGLESLYVGSGGQVWAKRANFDFNIIAPGQAMPGPTTNALPSLIANTPTAYTAGEFVSISGAFGTWYLQCGTGGTTSGLMPVPAPYTVPIQDGTVVWYTICRTNAAAVTIDTGSNECMFEQCDFSANLPVMVNISGGTLAASFHQCVIGGGFSTGISATGGEELRAMNCELGGGVFNGTAINFGPSYTGRATIMGNRFLSAGSSGVVIGGGTQYAITGNRIRGCPVGVNVGVSNSATIITDNIFDGSVSTPIQSPGNAAFIRSNTGYNPVGVTTNNIVGASPATITAPPTGADYYFSQSATNTATVSIGGVAVGTMSSGATIHVSLGPGESCVVTWTTTAPTYVLSQH